MKFKAKLDNLILLTLSLVSRHIASFILRDQNDINQAGFEAFRIQISLEFNSILMPMAS